MCVRRGAFELNRSISELSELPLESYDRLSESSLDFHTSSIPIKSQLLQKIPITANRFVQNQTICFKKHIPKR